MPGAGDLVGRDQELVSLAAVLDEARVGRGSVVTVSGEPGVGKTATVRAFASMAEKQGAATLWGAGFEGASQAPYGSWPVALAGPPDAGELPPQEARLRLFASVLEVLGRRAGETPVVVVVDDLQWAGSDSAELFGHVAARIADLRVVLVGTFRDPDPALDGASALAQLLAGLARLPHHRRLHLHGLDTDDVDAWLRRELGDEVPPAIVRAVRAQTGGNAFYVREVARSLIEDGKLVRRDGRWSSDFSLGSLRIPETVRDAVRGRVAGLSLQGQALLHAAALFPGDLHLAPVADVAGLAEEDALAAVDETLAAGLLQTTGRAAAPYAFAHAIVRHALADSLNPDRAARAHRRAAQALQRLRPDDHPSIAEQYWLSRAMGGAERGVSACLAAAEAAMDHHAQSDAIRMFEYALDLVGGDDVGLLERLAVAQAEALDYAAAPLTTTRVVDRVDGTRAAALIVRVVEALREGSPSSAYEPLVRRGLELTADDRGPSWARLATALEPVEPVSGGGLVVGRWRGYPPAAVAVLRATGFDDDAARAIEPFLARSEAETRALLDASSRWTSPRARMRALDLVGRDFSLRHGLPRPAVECYRELVQVGERVGSLAAQAEGAGQLALCLALVGELAEAEEQLDRAARLVRDLWPGHRLHLVGTLSSSAVVAAMLGTGEWSEMADRFSRWVRGPAAAGAPFATVFVSLAALCHAYAGDHAQARVLLDDLAAILTALAPSDHGVPGSLWFGTAAVWEMRDRARAGPLAALVDRHLAAAGPPGPAPLAHAAGRLAVLRGDRARGVTCLAAARAAAAQSGARGFGALVDLDEAEVRGDDDAFAAAARTCERLGMRGWAAPAASPLASATPRPSGLTPREVEVLALLAAGRTSQEIARQLVLALPTVNRHIANIYVKIAARNRAEATSYAIAHGLARPDLHSSA